MASRRLRITLWLVGIVVVLGAAMWLLTPRLIWDGAAPRKVRVHVSDVRTGAPISGATVTFAWSSDNSSGTKNVAMLGQAGSSHLTDAGGRAEWLAYFGAGGTSTIFGRTGKFDVSSFELQVSAAGYQPRTEQLPALLGGATRSISDKSPLEAEVRLSPAAVPATMPS